MNKAQRSRPLIEDLEERILYSADFAPAALAMPGANAADRQFVDIAQRVQTTAAVEVAFVDSANKDADAFIAERQSGKADLPPLEVVRIGEGEDGIARIAATLAGRDDVAAVHLFAGTDDAMLHLGATTLDAGTLLARAQDVALWGNDLQHDGSILLHGCDTVPGAQALTDALSVLTGVDAKLTDVVNAPASAMSADAASPVTLRHEIVFVDPRVEGYESLVADLIANAGPSREFEIVTLDPGRNGIDQVNDALAAETQKADALHFITHGTDGAVQMGNLWLRLDNVNEYASQLTQWGNALSADADVLLYGCDVADNAAGRALGGIL